MRDRYAVSHACGALLFPLQDTAQKFHGVFQYSSAFQSLRHQEQRFVFGGGAAVQ